MTLAPTLARWLLGADPKPAQPPPHQCPDCGSRTFLVRGGLHEFHTTGEGPVRREVGWYGVCASTECACRVTFDQHGFRKYDPTEVRPKPSEERDRKKRDPWAGLEFSGRGPA